MLIVVKNKIDKFEVFSFFPINTHSFFRDYPDTFEHNHVSNKFLFAIYSRFKGEEARERNVTNKQREQLVSSWESIYYGSWNIVWPQSTLSTGTINVGRNGTISCGEFVTIARP